MRLQRREMTRKRNLSRKTNKQTTFAIAAAFLNSYRGKERDPLSIGFFGNRNISHELNFRKKV